MTGPTCCQSGKVRYATALEAHAAREHASRGRRRAPEPVRTRIDVYHCGQCGGHHLGSRGPIRRAPGRRGKAC